MYNWHAQTAASLPNGPQRWQFVTLRWHKNIRGFLYFGVFPRQRIFDQPFVEPDKIIHPISLACLFAKIKTGACDLMAATWRGALSFGLLSIPTRLYPAARSQRTYVVFIRPRNHGITVHTMYFQNEIREVPGYEEKPSNLHLKPEEIKLAEQLIETLSEDFNPAKYHDTFQERLRALVEAKQKGKTVRERPVPRQAQVIDMMEALKKSLRETARAGRRRRVSAEHAGASRNGKRLAS